MTRRFWGRLEDVFTEPEKVAPAARSAATKASVGIALSATVIFSNALTGFLASRVLGPDGRGSIALLLAFAFLTAALGSFGLPEAVAAKAVATTASQRSQLVALSLGVSLPSALAVAPVVLWLATLDAGVPIRGQLLVLLALLPIRSAGLTATFALLARGRVVLHQALVSALAVGPMVAIVVVVAAGSRSTESLGWAVVVGTSVVGLAQIVAHGWTLALPSRDDAVAWLRFGFRSLLASVGTLLNQRADIFILSALGAAGSVGVYSNATSVASVALVATTAFGPRLRWAIAKGDDRGVRRWLLAALSLSGSLAIAGGIGAWLLFVPVYGEEFSEGRTLAVILAVLGPLIAGSRLLAIVNTANGRPSAVARAELVGALVGISTLLVLWSPLGLWAAVAGSAVGYSVALGIEWTTARPFLRGPLTANLRRSGDIEHPLQGDL